MDFANLALNQRLPAAINLLDRVTEHMEQAPDAEWWRDYFLFTGQHMVRTDEGWQPGDVKSGLIEEYGKDVIEDEVNAPA